MDYRIWWCITKKLVSFLLPDQLLLLDFMSQENLRHIIIHRRRSMRLSGRRQSRLFQTETSIPGLSTATGTKLTSSANTLAEYRNQEAPSGRNFSQ